jgi:subtilase family serine protease
MTHRWLTRHFRRILVAAACALTAAGGIAGTTGALAAPTGASPAAMRPACPVAAPGHLRCFALFRPQAAVNRAIAAGMRGLVARPKGWGARQLESAYKLPVTRNSHQTVAVSIAFDTPQLAQYLAIYRKQFGLPACTVASGCFRKVNQKGQATPLPASGVNTGWDLEATLDVSMISAACPHCKILVVEGKDNGNGNLAATENTAARLGAQVISNSYGNDESGLDQPFARAYRHPGHTIVVSSGDFGFPEVSFPANLTTVTAVGGTQLRRAHNARGWSERVWNQPSIFGASGTGCSAFVAKPSWQHDPHCPGRTTADVSAVASNLAIYNKDYGGWITVAGTSASAPLVAGVYGLAGNGGRVHPGSVYQHRTSLFDITSGNNVQGATPGQVCGDYLCAARPGYDSPTGLGTPDGTGAF